MRTLFVLFLMVFLLRPSLDAADKVRIAFGTGVSSLFFPIVQKKGFLRDEGIDAEVIQLGGSVGIAALVNGELDYTTTFNPAVRGAIQGLPIRVVACFDKGNQWVLVGRGNLKSVSELRGKTVAVGSPGQGPDTAGRRIVKHYGLEPDKDVKFTPGNSSNEGRLISLQQGLVDATLIAVPLDLRARKLGLNILARAQDVFTYAGGGLVTTTRKIKEKPDEIKRIIKAAIKASRYLKTNVEGTIQALMDLGRTDRDLAATAYEFLAKANNESGGLPEQGFRLLIDEVKESVKTTREIPFGDVSDISILREAQRELGIKAQ